MKFLSLTRTGVGYYFSCYTITPFDCTRTQYILMPIIKHNNPDAVPAGKRVAMSSQNLTDSDKNPIRGPLLWIPKPQHALDL